MTILLSDLQVWPWPSTYLNKCLKTNSYGMDKLNDQFIIWPSSVTLTFNLPEKMFQTALLLLNMFKENNCAEQPKLFWNSCINVEVMTWTNPDRCTYAHTHIHWTEVVTTMSHLLQACSTKKEKPSTKKDSSWPLRADFEKWKGHSDPQHSCNEMCLF